MTVKQTSTGLDSKGRPMNVKPSKHEPGSKHESKKIGKTILRHEKKKYDY